MYGQAVALNNFFVFVSGDYNVTEDAHFHVHDFQINLMFVIEIVFHDTNVKDAFRFCSFFAN